MMDEKKPDTDIPEPDSEQPSSNEMDYLWYGIMLSFFCCPAGVILLPLIMLSSAKSNSFEWLWILRWLLFI